MVYGNVYEFVVCVREEGNESNSYSMIYKVSAYSDAHATEKLYQHFDDLKKNSFIVPHYVSSPKLLLQGVLV